MNTGAMPRRSVWASWLFGWTLMLLSALVGAQTVNPLDGSPSAIRAGSALFRAQCATCHGADASGIEGIEAPDLTQLWARPETSDGGVFQTIRQGIPGSIMPPNSFTDTETWMLVSYLKSIGPASDVGAYTGDPTQGAELFGANCSECHRAAGSGGVLGPDLTRITRMRSRAALMASIRDPDASVAGGYRPVNLQTSAGLRVEGVVKSEDAFSIQIMDAGQILRGYAKAELRRLDYGDGSLMPAFGAAQLSEQDLEDILAYLARAAQESVSQ